MSLGPRAIFKLGHAGAQSESADQKKTKEIKLLLISSASSVLAHYLGVRPRNFGSPESAASLLLVRRVRVQFPSVEMVASAAEHLGEIGM